MSFCNPLSRLEESIEEEENEIEEPARKEFDDPSSQTQFSIVSKLSASLKSTNLGEKNQLFQGFKPDGNRLASQSSCNRSANEQLPGSISFVKLADMNEEEWAFFLEKFQELLCPAFACRKTMAAGQRQRRLGTSCQF